MKMAEVGTEDYACPVIETGVPVNIDKGVGIHI
jgi:hypothetical protein